MVTERRQVGGWQFALIQNGLAWASRPRNENASERARRLVARAELWAMGHGPPR